MGNSAAMEHLDNSTDFVAVESSLTRALTAWAVSSVLVGGVLMLAARSGKHAQAYAFGRQTFAWGAINAAIAGAGVLSRRRRGELSVEQQREKAQALRRLLLANAAADVAYVAVGLVVASRGRDGRRTARLRAGDGAAIAVQGAFLLALDASQAVRLPAPASGM